MKFVIFALLLSFFLLCPVTRAEFVSLDREDIIAYAHSAIGSRYIFGGSTWNPANRRQGGADCAGLVLKAWRWPVPITFTDTLKASYNVNGRSVPGKIQTGTMLQTERNPFPWTKSKHIELAKTGDALTYFKNGKGHTFLWVSASNGMVRSLEARSSKMGIGYFSRSQASIKRSGYFLLQRKNLKFSIFKTES